MRKHFFTLILAFFWGMGASWAQEYDFSAVCSTGQTLYYKIIDEDARKVKLTCPDFLSWGDFPKPTGEIIFPETVESNGVSYSVTEIDYLAFSGCSGLSGSLNIPNSVVQIDSYAFSDCIGFTGTLNISNSVIKIDRRAFSGCSGLTGSLIIPNSVTEIGDNAFDNCTGFNGFLTLGNSVTTIGEWAFSGCSGLRGSLNVPNSVASLGSYAFSECTGFTGSLTIGNSLSIVGEAAFYKCNGFKGPLILSSSVVELGQMAFCNCSGFSSIISKAAQAPLGQFSCLFGIPDSIPVYVPCGSTGSYGQAAYWNEFRNFHEIRPYDIRLFSSNETMGTVSFAQLPDCETGICKVKASPMPGYKFDYWMENGAQVSTEAEYSFEATADRTLTAYFSETLSVNSFAEPEVQLFPNPANDVLNVVCDGMRHITIMNTLGQVVYDAEPADAQSAQISLAGFDAGVYIVRITTDYGMTSKSVVKAEL